MKVQFKFTDDINLFDQLLEDISGYLKIEKQRFKSNQDALVDQFAAKENLQMAITACNKYLENQIENLPSHLEYFDFFKVIMSPALAKVYLRYGGKSKQWQTVDTIIRQCFLILSCKDQAILKKKSKQMSDIISQFSLLLTNAEVSIQNKNMLLEQLQEIHLLQLENKSLEEIYDSQLKFHHSISNFLLDHQQENDAGFDSHFIGHQHSKLKTAKYAQFHPTSSLEHASEICSKLSIGQWLSILIDQKPVRLQYGFYSRTEDSFVFFNSYHEKAVQRKREDLEKDFSSGFACLIEETANFDTALEHVAKKLDVMAA
jgi:hypothetical protein